MRLKCMINGRTQCVYMGTAKWVDFGTLQGLCDA